MSHPSDKRVLIICDDHLDDRPLTPEQRENALGWYRETLSKSPVVRRAMLARRTASPSEPNPTCACGHGASCHTAESDGTTTCQGTYPELCTCTELIEMTRG